ncbi:MAG TPA: DUF3828 domain-containing protein [Thermoanaerobaculia bacterium]|nr:DUF3828 domain-containing protein [Thermoanaerobaculia bacterium]
MKTVRLLIVCAIAFAAVAAQNDDPAAFVRSLYREHDAGRGPFFQTESKKPIARWFDARLTELIWKDALEAAGEVGRLDADPLYDSQDTDGMKSLKVRTVERKGNTARVLVTYDQFQHRYEIDFRLVREKRGWRITNIHYPRWSGDLRSILETTF